MDMVGLYTMANIHNVVSDLFEYMHFVGNDVVYTWTVDRTPEGTTALLTFKLNDRFFLDFPNYVRRPLGRCAIRVSALPDQIYFVEENSLFKGHDITRLMNWLVERDVAL